MIDPESIKAIGRSILAARSKMPEQITKMVGEPANPSPSLKSSKTNRYQFPPLNPQATRECNDDHFFIDAQPDNKTASINLSTQKKLGLSTLREIIKRCRHREYQRLENECTLKKQEGYQDGFTEGYESGLQSARQESITIHNQSAEKWNSLITELWNELHDLHNSTVCHLSEPLIELIAQVTSRVMNQELSISRGTIKTMLEDEIKQLPNSLNLRLHINPEDHDLLNPVLNNLPNSAVHLDSEIEPGGFILRSEKGEVDATIHRRLSTCLDKVNDALHKPATI